jgi:hypothetical protein
MWPRLHNAEACFGVGPRTKVWRSAGSSRGPGRKQQALKEAADGSRRGCRPMGFDLSWVAHAEVRRSLEIVSADHKKATQPSSKRAASAQIARISQRRMHSCVAHCTTPERATSQREFPGAFHEESAGSGTTITARIEPGRNV